MTTSEDIVIRKALLTDTPGIISIMENTFGPFPGLEAILLKWLSNENYSVQIALDGSNVVGVCTWYVKTDNDHNKYSCFGQTALDFLDGRKSAWIINLAVSPPLRKSGLGTRLALAHVDWLKETSCDIAAGSSWMNGSMDNSQHLFQKAGFAKLGESGTFLREQLKNGAICSVCETSDCRCLSSFYGIEIGKLISFMERTAALV